MKKTINKILSLLLSLAIIPTAITATANDTLSLGQITNDDVAILQDDDWLGDSPDYEEYLLNNTGISPLANIKSPNTRVNVTAQLTYTLKQLPKGAACQNFHITDNYIYVTQRLERAISPVPEEGPTTTEDVYISRCQINESGNIATVIDTMTLKGIGHNQILEGYTWNGKLYFIIGCKESNVEYTNDEGNLDYTKTTIQVGRIQYQPNVTINSYAQICRLSNFNYANESHTGFGGIKRVEAGISSDQNYIMFLTRNTNNNLQYTYCDFDAINELLDEKENQSSKFISFKTETRLQDTCIFSFTQSGAERVLPNGSCQGIDISNTYASIYISGGKPGDEPRIGKMIKNSSGVYEYSYCADMKNPEFVKSDTGFIDKYCTEIEGVKLRGDRVYFATSFIRNKSEQFKANDETLKFTQYIYSFEKSVYSQN